MHFTIDKSALADSLRIAARIAGRDTAEPVLSAILIRAEPGTVTIGATDRVVAITTTLPAAVLVPGAVAVSAAHVQRMIAEVPATGLNVASDADNRVSIECGAFRFGLDGFSATDFPTLPSPRDVTWFKIGAAAFCDLLAKTLHAASDDEERPHLCALNVEVSGGIMRVTATDGHRLCRASRAIDGAPPFAALLPLAGAREIVRALKGVRGEVDAAVTAHYLFLRTGTGGLSVRRGQEQLTFPSVDAVIPPSPKRSALVPREAFAAAVKRAAIVCSETHNAVRVRTETGRVAVEVDGWGFGTAYESIPAVVAGRPGEVTVNPAFLLDACKAMDGAVLRFGFDGPDDPVRLDNQDGAECCAVIMPMRVKDDEPAEKDAPPALPGVNPTGKESA